MSRVLVVDGAPRGSEAPCNVVRPAKDDLLAGVPLTASHYLAIAVAHGGTDLRF